MKVGIMSMQRIINYGSFLQAYALKMTMKSMGHDVEFVDYHIGEPVERERINELSQGKRLKGALKVVFSKEYRKKRKREIIQNESYGVYYNKFKSDWLPLLGVSEEKTYNPNMDVLIIGSDEVFNCTQSNPDVGYSPELFGVNSNAKKIITYAASFGYTTLDRLKKYNIIDDVSTYLKKIDSISVRDNNSYEILKKLIGIDSVINVDPVLLYDFEKEVQDNVDLNNYVIVYAYSGRITDEEAEAIQRFARNNGLKTLSIGVRQVFTDEYRCVDPFAMLAYFKKAKYVVTDTFHGTVFSIKFQVPFISFIRNSNTEKLSDLLDKFDLKYRAGTVQDIDSILMQTLDNDVITNRLLQYKKQALDYLTTNCRL